MVVEEVNELFVVSAIGENALPMPLVVLPFSFVLLALLADLNSIPMLHIILVMPIILLTSWPLVDSWTILMSFEEMPKEQLIGVVDFLADSMLHSVFEEPVVVFRIMAFTHIAVK